MVIAPTQSQAAISCTWSVRALAKYKGGPWTIEQLILTLMAPAPSCPGLVGRGVPPLHGDHVLRGNLRFVWASAHAPSQYFPVLLRPSGWAGHLFWRKLVLTLTIAAFVYIILGNSLNEDVKAHN